MELAALTPAEGVLLRELLSRVRREPLSDKVGEQSAFPNKATDCYVAYVPGGGILARSGTTPGSEVCDLYVVINDNDGNLSLVNLDETVEIANLSDSDISGDQYVLVIKNKGGIYVAVSGGGSGDRTAVVKVSGPLDDSTCCYPGSIETVAGDLDDTCDPFDTHTDCKIIALNQTGTAGTQPSVGETFIGQKIGTVGTGSGSDAVTPVYAIRLEESGGGGTELYMGNLAATLDPASSTASVGTLTNLSGGASASPGTVSNGLKQGGPGGALVFVVKNANDSSYHLLRVELGECS